jgi:plasmid replication initiation protein
MVSKDNTLIQAGYTLSLTEQRVILLCIAKWDSRKKIPDNHEFILSVDDVSREIGIARENAYRDLRSAVNSLYSRTIKLDPNDPDTEMRWLYQKAFFKEKGVVALRFSPSILPYISELKERFTSYRLKDVANFKSSYSIRFYEILVQYRDQKELKLSVQKIRDILQLGCKYPDVRDLKKYVIAPAVSDINTFSNLHLTTDQVKRGREVTHLIFIYSVCGVIDKKLVSITPHKNGGTSSPWEDLKTGLKE